MELSLPQLTDGKRLAALAQVYLALGLPLKAALDAAQADLTNLVAVQADIPPSTSKSRSPRLYLSHNRRALLFRIA
jgi:hypothetical protein